MNEQQQDVLYVADMAKKLGRTEKAIRAGIRRNAAWLPPHFRAGALYAWLRADVDAFLAQQAKQDR